MLKVKGEDINLRVFGTKTTKGLKERPGWLNELGSWIT
jgi:hypothetical protein